MSPYDRVRPVSGLQAEGGAQGLADQLLRSRFHQLRAFSKELLRRPDSEQPSAQREAARSRQHSGREGAMTGYWPWWLGGLALATVAIGFWRVHGRMLGVSGNFANFLKRRPADDDLANADPAVLAAALLEATREQFGEVLESSSAP